MKQLVNFLTVTGFIALFIVANQDPTPVWTNVELEQAINDAVANGTTVKLPAKVILDKTINLGLRQSLRFEGSGGVLMNYNQANVANRVAGSRIFWRGPTNQPIFTTAGVGIEWEGIAFILDNPTTACVHVIKGSGFGSGKHLMDSCSFLENPNNRKTSVGMLLGVTLGDGNCDECVMRNCISMDMKHMFMSVNHQSVGNRFYDNLSNRNESVFNFAAGGKVSIFGHSVVGDQCFLRLGEQGSNNNNFLVYGLSVDSGAPAGWRLIENPSAKNTFVTVEGHISGKAQGTRTSLILNDNARFDLSRLMGLQAEVTE